MRGAWRRSGRATAIVLAVLLAASGCGSDDASASGEDNDKAQALEQPLRPGDAEQDDASSDVGPTEGDSPTAAKPDSDQAVASEGRSALVPVQLGSRFPWCAEVQERWNSMIEARDGAAAAEVAYHDAREALEAATDELDAAEARAALEWSETALEESQANLAPETSGAVRLIIPGRPPLDDTTAVNLETHTIAVGRARKAFRASADPTTLELSELIHRVDWSAADLTAIQEPAHSTSTTTPPATTTPRFDPPEDPRSEYESILAAIDEMRVAVLEAPSALIPALEDLGHVIALAAAVESSEDVVAASRALMEVMHTLSQVPTFDRGDLQEMVDRYHTWVKNQYGWGGGEMSRAERDEYIWETSQAAAAVEFPDVSDQLPGWAATEFDEGQHPDYALAHYVLLASRHSERLLSELRPAGERFMLADTAAVEAFWSSVSESCAA